ncbi:hypothetical protein ACEPAG_2593 [Sanghuangporus baumii]
MSSASFSPPSSQSPSPSPSPPLLHASRPRRTAVEALKDLLNRTLRIACSDGRTFVGTFVCVDKQLHIILANTDEYSMSKPEGRYVTMVMVPWRLVVTISVHDDGDGDEEGKLDVFSFILVLTDIVQNPFTLEQYCCTHTSEDWQSLRST